MNENQNEYVDINAHDNYPDSDQKIEVPTMKVIPLKKICMTIGQLPTAYLETMSYYEMLIWFIEYLKNNIIPTINNNASAVQEVQAAVLALQQYINNYKDSIDSDVEELEDYMNNYFENLDVQDEINNKLEEMLEDGVLEQIIEQYIQSSALWCFDNVNDMKSATNLIDGSYAKTLGYYSKNDGGGAEYKIRTKTIDDIIDNGSIIEISDTLVAELNVNDSINIKQFGAKGNGTDLDNTAFTNALLYIKNSDIKKLYFNNGNYLLSVKLELPSGKYYGLGNATLTETDSTDEVFITNEHFLDYDYQDEIEIKDLTIVKTSLTGGSLNGKRCFRFACTNNLHMDNITMKSSVDSQFGAIDLYSYNTNALIENCEAYKTGTLTATSLVGGYAVREYSETHTSKNISIINCLIDKDGIDESLWISGWFGNLEHVYVNNMKIYDRTNSEGVTTCFIDRCSDVTIENSYIYKLGNGYRLIQIATDEEHHQRLVENLFINNNVFEIENSSNTSQYCSFISVDSLVGSRGIFIENNKFYFNGTNNTKIGCFYIFNESATIKSINNIFNGNCQQLGFNVKYSINDTLNGNCSNTIFENPEYIKEFKNNGTTPYFYKLALNNAVRNNIKIENCDVVANRIFQNNGSTITTTHTFINSNLINTQEFEADFTLSNDTKQTLNIFNCNIGHLPISWEKYNILNVNNLTLNNVLVKGIPTSANDRYNYPIGTVFFSGTPTKSIVRKISDGDSTSNWEEI